MIAPNKVAAAKARESILSLFVLSLRMEREAIKDKMAKAKPAKIMMVRNSIEWKQDPTVACIPSLILVDVHNSSSPAPTYIMREAYVGILDLPAHCLAPELPDSFYRLLNSCSTNWMAASFESP